MTQFSKNLLGLTVACCLAVASYAQTHVVTIVTGSFASELSWELLDGATVVASGACGTIVGTTNDTVTLAGGTTYTFNAYDDYGDSWNGGTWEVTDLISGCAIASGVGDNGLSGDFSALCDGTDDLEESVSFDPADPIAGCIDPGATNYNPCATVSDGSCVYPAVNDACGDAIALPVGTCYSGTNVGATFGGDTLDASCSDGSLTPSDVWFSSTVPASGNLTIEFPVVPGFSSIVELYYGTCGALGPGVLAAASTCVNFGQTVGGLTPGAPILVRYWDFGSDQEGAFELCLSEPTSGCVDPCASNYDTAAVIDDGSCIYSAYDVTEDCASALTLPGDGTYSVLNSGATPDALDVTSCAFNDVVAVYANYAVPTGIDTLKIWTCGSSYDTALSLWDGCPSDPTSSEVGCNDDGQVAPDPANPFSSSSCGGVTLQSAIILTDSALDALEGTTIVIRIAGYNGQSGCGDLNIETFAASCDASTPPQNPGHTDGISKATLFWDALPLSVACQVKGNRLVPPGPSPTVNLFGSEPTTTNVPYSAAGAGTTWSWSVRCACSTSPIIATGFSVEDTFMVPAPPVRLSQDEVQLLFPNPADNMTFVSYVANEASANVEFAVVDVMGRIVDVQTMDVVSGLNNVQFDVSGLEAGVYFVQISNGSEVTSEQFTIAR